MGQNPSTRPSLTLVLGGLAPQALGPARQRLRLRLLQPER